MSFVYFDSSLTVVLGHDSLEELWRQFFADPSQWWNYTNDKVNFKYPDFRHKKTGLVLWIDRTSNPSWVRTELASMTPGSVSRSLRSWNAVLSGFVKADRGQDAVELYTQMQADGIEPDSLTFVKVLKACTGLAALEEGRLIHAQVIVRGWECDLYIGSTLVDMYSKCGSIEDAQRVFQTMQTRDVVSWNAMLNGCVKCKEEKKALDLFTLMQADGVNPNRVTVVIVLNACGSLVAVEEGRRVHKQAVRIGLESDVVVGNALVDMYSKCGSVVDARRVFQTMPSRDVISWTAMLSAYVKKDQGWKALELFSLMGIEGLKANSVTFVVVLNACASVMSLDEGRRVHGQIIQNGFESNLFVGNTLVDMYAKCGCIADAQRVFHGMSTRDVVSWNAMLAGYLKCEEGQKALGLFAMMEYEAVKPNAVTFVVVLNVCASIMALEDGIRAHTKAIQSGWDSDVVVGNTLVDMYAKCGSIDDAQRVFQTIPCRNVVSWTAMLGGFAIHGHGKNALLLFKHMSDARVKMNVVTFLCLLSACSHAGLLKEGIRCFESMGSVYGILPTVEHYACMVDLLGRAGHWDEAEDLFRREPKLREDRVAWMSLLGACRSHCNVNMEE